MDTKKEVDSFEDAGGNYCEWVEITHYSGAQSWELWCSGAVLGVVARGLAEYEGLPLKSYLAFLGSGVHPVSQTDTLEEAKSSIEGCLGIKRVA